MEVNLALPFSAKKTVIDLFTNYLRFTPFSNKVGLVRALLHCVFMTISS